MDYQFLHLLNFSDLKNWSVQFLLGIQSSYNDNYPLVPLGNFLIRNKKPVEIQYDKEYKRVTIKINNGGVFLRDIEIGKNIGTKNQFEIKESQFILSKIDARNGAFGIANSNVDGAIITGNFWAYDVDYSKIDPIYLSLITTTNYFIKFCQKSSVGTTNRNYLQEELFLAEQIPLPDIDIQKSLVSAYQEKIRQAEILKNQAEQIDIEIEQYLFESLGIQIEKTISQQNQGILQFMAFKELKKWSVSNTDNIAAETVFLSKKYNNEPITNYFFVNPTTITPKDKEISFIPMANISDEHGEIISKERKKLQNNYTRFQENDLLWAKITPCMQNGKSAVANDLLNGFGFGSTEFHILRNKNSIFDIRLLHLLLRSKRLLTTAMTYFTGSA
ncbi:hypothetical protein Q7323_11325, partial [Glaesserella parasuis]|nr:hypothetical protein [Glaesserella parasuis]